MSRPKLSEMTLREKIGQTALVSQRSIYKLMERPDVKEYMEKYPFGGLWVHGASNVGDMNHGDKIRKEFKGKSYAVQYAQFIDKLNGFLGIPLLTGCDAESGCNLVFPEMTQTSTTMALGATNSEELAYETGVCVATECSYGGINWIWGPVSDLALSNRGNSSSGRCYSDNPEIVEKLANAYLKGVQSCGIAATAKHFPGPGHHDTRDSHGSNTVNYDSFEVWEKEQGALFQSTIDAGVMSIMVGHSGFPAVDNRKEELGGYIPSTLSEKVITDLLKKKMHFDGVVITDGIGMKSLIMTRPIDKLYVELLQAGNDVILGVNDIEVYLDAVENAVKGGQLSEERIDDACTRIFNMKEKLGLFEKKEKELAVPNEVLERTKILNKKVAQKSITKLCDKNNLIPLSVGRYKKILGIYLGYNDDTFELLGETLTKAFGQRGAEFKLQKFLDEELKHDELEQCEIAANENDLIVYFADLPNGNCDYFTGETWRTSVFSLVYGNEKSIVVSLRSPSVYYEYFTFAKTFLMTFGISEGVIQTLVEGLYGELPFTGKSPVELIPEYARESYNL